jgi:dTDP-glucose 4,6-dehydratase
MKKILVTGGCGFIGSCFVIKQIEKGNLVINIDNLTYSGNLANLEQIKDSKNYHFVKGDICDQNLSAEIFNKFDIDWVVNFAAETHVDNSIAGPEIFVKTNVNGVFSLLNNARNYWQKLEGAKKENFRFLHISTDEVYGSLEENDPKFNEENPYRPNSPYSASKAASDHLVRAWFHTYKLPVLTTNCSNNFGPRQHQEKLIPTIISAAIENKNIPIYGNGKNIRDWIFVEDHCDGVELALLKGKIGETYCFGGDAEMQNIEIAKLICKILDNLKPRADKKSYAQQITFVNDRAGHDWRYAIDNKKARGELGFSISKNFEERLTETVKWYLSKK